MDFPAIIPSAGLSAEQRAQTVAHPVFEVQSTRHPGRMLYVKRLDGPVTKPPSILDRWMLAAFALRPGSGPVVVAKPFHAERHQYLVAWTQEALQAPGAVLAPQRTI